MATPGDLFNELARERVCSEIGTSIYLLIWLRQDQFHRRSPITYKYIAAQTGFNERTLERWMRLLSRGGFVRVESGWNGMHVRLRSRFAPGPAQDGDFEEIRTFGWQRAPKVPSDEVEQLSYAHAGRDRREPGAMQIANAYSDSDPEFMVESASGRRSTEYLHDSDPPMERSNARAAAAAGA